LPIKTLALVALVRIDAIGLAFYYGWLRRFEADGLDGLKVPRGPPKPTSWRRSVRSSRSDLGSRSQHDNFMWDKTKTIPPLESYDPDVLFVCGSCRNRDEFRPYFTKVFNLKIDDNTMR